ncbi:MAG: SecY-interacting protein [Ferrimonas sp.]
MLYSPLNDFLQAYQRAWQPLPQTEHDEDGPALVRRNEDGIALWQAAQQIPTQDFANVAEALALTLHEDVGHFYGQWYAGSLYFQAAFGRGELLQVWNDDDRQRLQQNLIGHLLMKRKLKQAPTIFLGVLGEGEEMIVLDNDSGSIWLEIPGERPHQQLAPTLRQFFQQLTPRPHTVVAPIIEAPLPVLSLRARFASMWRVLWPWRR